MKADESKKLSDSVFQVAAPKGMSWFISMDWLLFVFEVFSLVVNRV